MSEKMSKKNKIRDVFYDLIPEETYVKKCKITLLENEKIMVEGYKNIIDFSSSQISIAGINIEIDIYGNNLYIEEVSEEDLLIQGEVTEVFFKK